MGGTYEDHPVIAKARRGLDIGEDQDFLAAIAPKFIAQDASTRKHALAELDAAQTFDRNLRQEGQLADVLDRHEVTVAGDPPPAEPVPTEDVREVTVDGVRITLTGDAHVDAPSEFTLTFADAASGAPVEDLEPYLGAAGHVVVLREDGTRFAHRHAEMLDDRGRPVPALPGTEFGPELDMHARFEVGGAYRLWAQFRLGDGTVVTAPFVVHAG